MAEDRPNELPRWASDASAEVTTPSVAKRQSGWFADESPAAGFLNWMQRTYGRWLEHYGSRSSMFTSLLEACGATGEFPLDVGDTCMIDEGYDPGKAAGEAIESYDPTVYGTSAKTTRCMCTDGAYLYVGSASGVNGNALVVQRILREDGSVDGTWSVTTSAVMTDGGGVVWDMYTDGDVLVIATSAALEVFDVVAGGTATWGKTFVPHDLRRCWADRQRVYVTNVDDVLAYTRSDGTLEWTFDHGAEVTGIASDGFYFYVFGRTSAHASGADLRRLEASDGSSATVEGGTAAGGSDLWDFVFASAPTNPGDLKLGRNGEVFLAHQRGGAEFIERHHVVDGSELWSVGVDVIGSVDLGFRIAVDQDYVWGASAASGTIQPLTYGGDWLGEGLPATNGPVRLYTLSLPCCDGSFVWSGGPVLDSGLSVVGTVSKISRGSTIRHWRRINPTSTYALPLQQLIVPA